MSSTNTFGPSTNHTGSTFSTTNTNTSNPKPHQKLKLKISSSNTITETPAGSYESDRYDSFKPFDEEKETVTCGIMYCNGKGLRNDCCLECVQRAQKWYAYMAQAAKEAGLTEQEMRKQGLVI